jgi:hypothetical protein
VSVTAEVSSGEFTVARHDRDTTSSLTIAVKPCSSPTNSLSITPAELAANSPPTSPKHVS